MQIVIRQMEKCLTLLIIRDMQIEAIVRYHLTPIRMAIIKKTRNKALMRMWRKENTHTLLFGM